MIAPLNALSLNNFPFSRLKIQSMNCAPERDAYFQMIGTQSDSEGSTRVG